MKKKYFFIGLIVGSLLFGSISVLSSNIIAKLSEQGIYVNGRKTNMTTYSINDNNYVRLRDIGEELCFSVLYDDESDSVYIDKDSDYNYDDKPLSKYDVIIESSTLTDIYFEMFCDFIYYKDGGFSSNNGRFKYMSLDLSKIKTDKKDEIAKRIGDLCEKEGLTLILKTFSELREEGYIEDSLVFIDGFHVELSDLNLSDTVTKTEVSIWWASIAARGAGYIVRKSGDMWVLLEPLGSWIS